MARRRKLRSARAARRPRSAARRLGRGGPARAGAPLPRLLRGDGGGRRFPHAADAARRRSLRPLLRPPARHRPLAQRGRSRFGLAEHRRHLSAAPPGGRRGDRRLLQRRRIRPRAAASRESRICAFLELGRSCVLPDYRNKRTLELLWHGIWAYVLRHGFDVMIGCASLEGTDPEKLALPLSFLHHHCRAPEEWRVGAHADRRVEMNRMPAEAIDAEGGASRAAAAHQRISPARRLRRRRRRHRPPVRHDRRRDRAAGRGDQRAATSAITAPTPAAMPSARAPKPEDAPLAAA